MVVKGREAVETLWAICCRVVAMVSDTFDERAWISSSSAISQGFFANWKKNGKLFWFECLASNCTPFSSSASSRLFSAHIALFGVSTIFVWTTIVVAVKDFARWVSSFLKKRCVVRFFHPLVLSFSLSLSIALSIALFLSWVRLSNERKSSDRYSKICLRAKCIPSVMSESSTTDSPSHMRGA